METNGINMSVIQMQMAQSKFEDSNEKSIDGAKQLSEMKDRRAILKEKIKEQKQESETLASEIEKLGKRNLFETIVSDLNPFDTNDDDLQADAKQLSAEIEQKQHDLEGLQEKQKQQFEEIQNAQGSVKQTVEALQEISRDLRDPVQSLA